MSTHGSNKRPTNYEPTSIAINNYILIVYKSGGQITLVDTIYEYKRMRQDLINGIKSDIAFLGLIKPKDESLLLNINPNSDSLKRHLKNKQDENTDE